MYLNDSNMTRFIPTKEQLNAISKNPIALLVFVALILLGVFIPKVFSTNDEANEQLRERVKAAEIRADRAEAMADRANREKYELAERLLITNRILQTANSLADSTAKAVVDKSTKIVKKQKTK